ncbi:calcium-activated chloride channel-domain-containing protein [Lineolata rhizophorae]|uniref:Calcium-activated chloride channel-domain-containing protein n=1 Tax=Lineolata rhizophorae TaxID=578093 RepID=A0A6A6P1A9_9PEZI|nr:calcium-activated chloride channel-domain-containing protein [Lineolata rhizophorae]
MAPPKSPGLQTNMDVDYVICYRFTSADRSEATAQFEKLTKALQSVGLDTEVRNGASQSLLVFVKVASQEHLYGEVFRSRVKDWIHGVRAAAPKKETKEALESDPLNEAERLRIIYQLITNSPTEGGAGITPKEGEWKNVESIFALHDHAYNKEWIKKWSTAYFLKAEDLDAIRDRLGEKIGFYFAFTQSYFAFLVFPAVFGFSAWTLLGQFSPVYAIVISLWCIIFTEYWKHQEYDLAVRWGVRGVSSIETKRKGFQHEKEITDPVTGETVKYYPAKKRLMRQLLQIPFALVATIVLGTLIATCFGIEIFIREIYNGPLQFVLVFLPTGILTTCLPILTAILTNFASQLNSYENYETDSSYETAFTQKIFVLNFITSYLAIFLTAFVYVPFGSWIIPYLDIFSVTVKPFAENEQQLKAPEEGFTINPDRLRKQVIYFTVTAQLVNLGMEVVVPYLKRRGFAKFKKMQSDRAAKNGGGTADVAANDPPEEAAFLARVRNEAELDVYDVTTDLREMVLQFGYLALFSVVWPLTGVSFLINDWVELRADAIKICVEMQRPTPWRADTIGPWLDSLSFLAWLGSITTSALVYMFSHDGVGHVGTPADIKAWALLLCVFLSEHAFLLVRWAVRIAIGKLDSPGRQKERRERFLVRRKYFEESLAALEHAPKQYGEENVALATGEDGVKISRESLEEEARRQSEHGMSLEERFWGRQKGWRECAEVGKRLIERASTEAGEGKKEQ